MFADKEGSAAQESSSPKSVNDERAEIEAIQAIAASDTRAEESALQSAINTCKDGVVIGDLWGYITHVNEAVVKMLGASDASIFVGKHVLNFLPEEDRGRVVTESLNSIATNQGRTGMYRVISKSGEELQLEVTVDFIRDKQGEKIGFIDIVRNITETR